MKYPYVARSSTDPNGDKGGLGYLTVEAAQAHVDVMNQLRLEYPAGIWNTDFWKKQPGEWAVYKEQQ